MQRLVHSARSLALWILVLGLLVFVAVFVGWLLIFKPVVPHISVAIGIALFFAAVALLLARSFAAALAARRTENVPIRWYHYLAYLFLFMISGMGTVNAAFVLWEGSSVVRQDMAEVRDAYTDLSVTADQRLRLASHEKKSTDLEALLVSLRKEIDNPFGGNYCGVGEAANAIITQIRQIVPQMPIIRGTGPIRPCDPQKAAQVYEAYATSARAALQRDPAYKDFNGGAKLDFLETLRGHADSMRSSFETIDGLLSDPTVFGSAQVQGPLASAAANYAEDYKRLAALAPALDPSLPNTVDVTQSQELGSFAAFFEIFANRMGYVETWVYLMVAVLLDVGMVYFLTQAFLFYRRRTAAEEVDPYRQPGPRPKFLWVNPPVDPRNVEVRLV